MYTLESIQNVPININTAWEFLSDPGNLSRITPSSMDFRITSEHRFQKMYPGLIISYTVKPLAGIPLNWVTEITHVNEPFHFVDEQRSGPYKFWHHQHFLKEIPGGTQMRDIVHYALPMGILGNMANMLFIKNQLKTIFQFRKLKLIELFGEYQTADS